MSQRSTQKTQNYTNTIGTTSFGTGTKTTEIDNIFYDTRCLLTYGFRPTRKELRTVSQEDDEGNDISYSVEIPVTNESGIEIKEDFVQCEDAYDEVYFFHVWDWEKDLNSSRQKAINRTIRGIKETITGGGEDPIVTTYSVVSDNINWTLTLDRVDVAIEGIPTGKDINLYTGGTNDNKIFFTYNGSDDTPVRTVVKIGDQINGATVTKVLNFAEGLGARINRTTLCYAEISGGSSFTADASYTASQSGASIKVIAGKGIRTRSAAVGIYIDRDHKSIVIEPILYKNNRNTGCEREVLSDSDADYVKGQIILSDGSVILKNKWFVTKPKTKKSIFVYNVLISKFKLSPERDLLKKWISTSYNNDSEFEEDIIREINELISNDKYSKVVDTCYNELNSNAFPFYNPIQELAKLEDRIVNINSIIDECNEQNINSPKYSKPSYKSVDEFNKNLSNLISNPKSSIPVSNETYKNMMINQQALFNRIKESVDIIEETFKDQLNYNIDNNLIFSESVEAQNENTNLLIKNSYRDIPPQMSNVNIIPKDINVDDTKFDIVNPSNIIRIQVYSIPRFNFSTISNTSNYNISVDTSSNYLVSVTATAKQNSNIISGPGGTGLNQGLKPHIIWSASSSVQSIYNKDFRFRTVEFSDQTSKLAKSKGNAYKNNHPLTILTRSISSSDTTIYVKDTNRFLSSGYLVIPKFVKKIEVYGNGNIRPHFIYEGEEIIYYSDKTNNSFTGCIRGRFNTNSNFSTSLQPYSINTGSNSVSTSYTEGNSIAQFYNYKLES
jgi:hypothetical protein